MMMEECKEVQVIGSDEMRYTLARGKYQGQGYT